MIRFLCLSPALVAGFLGSVLPVTLPAGARAEEMRYPLSSAVTPDGTIYVADRKLPGIWKVADGKAEVFHRASKKFRTPLNAVWCVAFDSQGRLLAGDSATREVYRFDKNGKPTPLTDGAIGIPICIASDGKGTLYVSDLETHRIWSVSEEGGKPKEFAVIRGPRGITVGDKGRLWAINAGKNQLVRFTPEGKREAVVTGRPFCFPHCVTVAGDGTAFVSDGYGQCLWKVVPGESPEKLVEGKPFVNPVGLTWVDKALLVTDPRAEGLYTVTTEGTVEKLVAEPQGQK